MAHAGDRVAAIEQHWSTIVGTQSFEQMCATMQRLLDHVNADEANR